MHDHPHQGVGRTPCPGRLPEPGGQHRHAATVRTSWLAVAGVFLVGVGSSCRMPAAVEGDLAADDSTDELQCQREAAVAREEEVAGRVSRLRFLLRARPMIDC